MMQQLTFFEIARDRDDLERQMTIRASVRRWLDDVAGNEMHARATCLSRALDRWHHVEKYDVYDEIAPYLPSRYRVRDLRLAMEAMFDEYPPCTGGGEQ